MSRYLNLDKLIAVKEYKKKASDDYKYFFKKKFFGITWIEEGVYELDCYGSPRKRISEEEISSLKKYYELGGHVFYEKPHLRLFFQDKHTMDMYFETDAEMESKLLDLRIKLGSKFIEED